MTVGPGLWASIHIHNYNDLFDGWYWSRCRGLWSFSGHVRTTSCLYHRQRFGPSGSNHTSLFNELATVRCHSVLHWFLCGWVLRYHHWIYTFSTLQWSHNGRDGISNHQPHDCLLNRLFRCRAKNASKVRATGLCEGYSPGSVEFPAQMSSNAENVSIWWRHHGHLIMQVKPSSQAAKSCIVVT